MIKRDERWRRRRTGPWLVALALSLFAMDPARAQSETPPARSVESETAPDAEPPEGGVAQIDLASQVPALLREDATQIERERSASELIAGERWTPLREALFGDRPEASVAARAAIARTAGSPELFALLEEAAIEREGAESLAAARLLSTWTARDAVRALVRVLLEARRSERPGLARAAAASLTQVTGRDVSPADPSAWLAWWSDAEWLPEADWQAALAQAHRERAAAEASERELLESKVLDLYQRLHAQTPSEGRTELLREMLESSRRSVRVAGLRLVERALLNGRVVAPALGPPAAAMLRDPDPEVRRLAARSLLRFAPDVGAPAALAALEVERDADAAATLMDLASANAPATRAAEIAEPWLEQPAMAGDAAANLIRTVLEQGRSPGDAFENRVREAAGASLEANPTPAVIRLLARVGADAELEAVATVLASERQGAVALAAVRAMETMPGGLARLMSLAEAEPRLRPIIADALSRGAGGLEPYRFLLRLTGLPVDVRREALHRLWNTLSPDELAIAASETPSPNLRAEFLSGALSGSNGGAGNGGAEPPPGVRAALTLLLAETRLEQDRVSEALETLGRLAPEAQRDAGADLAVRLLTRLMALREKEAALEEQESLKACAPATWAEALRRLAAADPAVALAAAEWAELAAHVRSDDAAGAVFDEAARSAGRAVAADHAAEAEHEAEETAQPEPGGAEGSIRPATRS